MVPTLALLVLVLLETTSSKSVGILYEVWHTRAATAMRQVVEKGGQQLTVEDVIRSNGQKQLSDIYAKYGLGSDFFNVRPDLGFYCIYRKRANETGLAPDCPNISATLKQHAGLLVSTGFDYIAVDVTNWPGVSTVTDLDVLRPIEVLFEEWLALRQAGQRTPQIALWPCSPAGGNTWQWLLDNVYNNPVNAQLLYRENNEPNGKFVMFVPKNDGCYPPPDVLQHIQSNGGRNNIAVQPVWALMAASDYANNVWGFFSPCVAGGSYSTSVVGPQPCNQYVSSSGGQVVEVSASASYQLSWSSLPGCAPGKLRGLTLKKLFATVFQSQPANVFTSSFNEFIGGRQPSPYQNKINTGFCQGLPDDADRWSLWVDTYGSEFSRDIEPTAEYGNVSLSLMASCIRVYRSGRQCQPSGDPEPCCDLASSQVFANVWSLRRSDNGDRLLTVDENEKNVLVQSGGWHEICNPFSGPTSFCVDGSQPDGRSAPFILYNTQLPGTVALFRCTIGTQHFFTISPTCENQKVESVLGYISTTRGGETLRSLRRCYDHTTGVHWHSLDLPCDAGNTDSGVYGYVR